MHKLTGSYKGYIAENFVAQELVASQSNTHLISYKKNHNENSAEIEFLLTDKYGDIIPVEVKSSRKSLRSKSLESYIDEYNPKKAFKLAPVLGEQKKTFSLIPIYMAGKLPL